MSFYPYLETIEYVSGTKAGVIRPLTIDEMDDRPRDWVERMWVSFEVMQEIENEQNEAAAGGKKQKLRPLSVEESLANMSEIGM